MELFDFNRTHVPPLGFTLDSFDARGAYLWARYKQNVFLVGTLQIVGYNVIVVYLNDMGREVARISEYVAGPLKKMEDTAPPPLTQWQKIKEMFKCQNK